MSQSLRGALAASSCLVFLAGCASPQLAVPYGPDGYPNALSINQRIRCELADMVRKHEDPSRDFAYRDFLTAGNYRVVALLTLSSKRTVGAKPQVDTTTQISGGLFKFGIGANVAQIDDFSSSTFLEYRIDEIADDIRANPDHARCRDGDNLAGRLDIAHLVATSAPLPLYQESTNQTYGQFGGTITFTVTSGVSSIGPTWILQRISGPGAFGSYAREQTNKVTFAFYQRPLGEDEDDPESRAKARDILRDIIAQDTIRQLSAINSGF